MEEEGSSYNLSGEPGNINTTSLKERIAQKKRAMEESTPKEVDPNNCAIHNKKLEVICYDCRIRICPNCALFGGHRSHDIREEHELLQEITLRAELLLDIYQLIEQNKSNMGDQAEVDDLYNQFIMKQISLKKDVANKFKEINNELLRKEKAIMNILERNFDSIEKTFGEIKNGPKKVVEIADKWCEEVQEKMEKFESQTEQNTSDQEYIAFEMLEDVDQENDIIRVGEKVLADLDKQIQPPIPQLEDKLRRLIVQFDEHFINKLEMVCHVPDLSKEDGEPYVSPPPSDDIKSFEKRIQNKPEPMVKTLPGPLLKKKESAENNLLDEDDDNLLTTFDMSEKIESDNSLLPNKHDDSMNFLDDIPDPISDSRPQDVEPGDTDAAYDIISEVLENQKGTLDLSNRRLGDDFFISMIESIIDFADGEPLSVINLNFSNNDISDIGCEKICEFLIIHSDSVAAHISNVNLSCNNVGDKSVAILETLCAEHPNLQVLNLSNCCKLSSAKTQSKFGTLQNVNVIL
ncbi:unnamed protein product [Moneuplotes crassus]|uniref:B box-type domain-containing protein n=1 Tax=Euplotes crassus TaxID=5936 RepID=A0AAD1X2Z5_EUPCR|nr:unnamed protein product [Moneuplotes crassus]